MSKFTIEYRRTVRVRPYETLTIGVSEEFSTDEMPYIYAFNQVREMVRGWIKKDLERIREEMRSESETG